MHVVRRPCSGCLTSVAFAVLYTSPSNVHFSPEDTKIKGNKSKPLNQKNRHFRLLKLKCVLILAVKLTNLIFFHLDKLTEIFLGHIEDAGP